MSMQVSVGPAPEATKPAAQAQVKPPAVLVQTFDALRLRPHAVVGLHSLMSMQLR